MAAADTAAEVWLVRGEGGDIIPMSPPLGEGIAARLRAGACLRVNPDGTPWTPPAEAAVAPPASLAEKFAADEFAKQRAEQRAELPRPRVNDAKAKWTAYAVSTGRITEAAAEDLTKDELVTRFGG